MRRHFTASRNTVSERRLSIKKPRELQIVILYGYGTPKSAQITFQRSVLLIWKYLYPVENMG